MISFVKKENLVIRAPKRKCFWEYDAVSMTILYKFFLLWFHKILQLIFHKEPSFHTVSGQYGCFEILF